MSPTARSGHRRCARSGGLREARATAERSASHQLARSRARRTPCGPAGQGLCALVGLGSSRREVMPRNVATTRRGTGCGRMGWSQSVARAQRSARADARTPSAPAAIPSLVERAHVRVAARARLNVEMFACGPASASRRGARAAAACVTRKLAGRVRHQPGVHAGAAVTYATARPSRMQPGGRNRVMSPAGVIGWRHTQGGVTGGPNPAHVASCGYAPRDALP
jgi:hypothetical protein